MTETQDFNALGLSEQMLEAVRAKGFETPTSIQALTIPRLLENQNDIIAQSQTGTGKTAAFGLPILQILTPSKQGVQAIILVPTRELALQASEELLSYNAQRRLSITAIYGGASMTEQLRRLSKGVDIVVGTPGRVLDHIRRGTLKLGQIRFLVLDEADEMLNMGFVEDVEEIMSHTPDERRVLLFSATMPERIVRLSKTYMRNTEIVRVENKQLTTELTEQIYFEVREPEKFDALTRIIDVESDFYGIVFMRTKIAVDDTVAKLANRGYAAEALHGDVSQGQREKILRKFKSRAANILVATDVAARGIDIGNLTHVINYSLPQDSESYVHRIGRTGRAGNQGTAITFISPSEFRKFNYLVHDIHADVKKETLPTPEDIVAMKRAKIREDMQGIIDNETYADYTDIAREMLADYAPEVALGALLRLAFRSELDQGNYPEIRTFSVDRSGTTRLLLGVGRRDGYTARKVVDMLKYKCGLRDKHIDDVKLGDDYAFVRVPFSEAEEVVRKLNSRGHSIAEIANDDKESAPASKARKTRKTTDEGAAYSRESAPRRPYNREVDSDASERRPRRSAAGDSDDRSSRYVRESKPRAPRGEAEAPRKERSRAGEDTFSQGNPRAEKMPSDFAAAGNEGFDWSAFMKYDDGENWGRSTTSKGTKSVRKSPKKPVTAAKRVATKGRR